ncbi:MAG: hypothetical protein QM831_30780 [Kofleriaceae bacterium]
MLRWLAALVVLFVAVPAHADDWKKFESKDGKFTMLFPSDPKLQESPIDTANGGKVTMYNFIWEEPTTHDVAYLAGYLDVANGKSDSARLDDATGGLVTKMGKPKSQKDIKFAGLKGREIVIEAQNMELTYRLFIKGDRLYTLGAVHGAGSKTPYDPKKFLDSLVITK